LERHALLGLGQTVLIWLSTRLTWWCSECRSASDDMLRVLLASDDRHGASGSTSAFCSVFICRKIVSFSFIHAFVSFLTFPLMEFFIRQSLNKRSWISNLEFPTLRTHVCLRTLKCKLHVRSVYLRKCKVSHRTENIAHTTLHPPIYVALWHNISSHVSMILMEIMTVIQYFFSSHSH
jgi:hypothetical protein